MRVAYRCKVCAVERTITVPDRARAVDVKLWLDGVADRAGVDHSIARPSCPSRVVDLLIPVSEEATHIGAPGSDSKAPPELPSFDTLDLNKREDTPE